MNRLETIREWARKGPSDEVPTALIDLLLDLADAAIEVDASAWDTNDPPRLALAAALAPLLEDA